MYRRIAIISVFSLHGESDHAMASKKAFMAPSILDLLKNKKKTHYNTYNSKKRRASQENEI
jgi:hypothetical protein